MQLIKSEHLSFQDDKSDKVYEVELYQLQDDEYIVNFRYGRRGSRLKEGTKTVFPVPLNNAEKIYSDLIQSKLVKGYQSSSGIVPDDISEAIVENASGSEIELQILKYLEAYANRIAPPKKWKLSRIIWKAGELKIEKALRPIAMLLSDLEGQAKYAAFWYLGRLGNQECLNILKAQKVTKEDLWSKIYMGGLMHCKSQNTLEGVIAALPNDLKTPFLNKDYVGFIEGLKSYLFTMRPPQVQYLLLSYYLSIGNPAIKNGLLMLLSTVPLKPNYWKNIRYIFKIAQMIDDGETFGLISARINASQAYFRKNPWGSIWINQTSYKFKEEIVLPNSKLAFSNTTRDYFIRRSLKTLKKAGIAKKEFYCDAASSMLLAYSENDYRTHYPEYKYQYNSETRRHTRTEHPFSKLAHIPIVFYILYSAGSRFEMLGKRFAYADGMKEQSAREDAFSQLWDRYPKYAVRLLKHGQLKEVTDFAIRVLENRKDLVQLFSNEDMLFLLQHSFKDVVDFSLKVIEQKYDSTKADVSLIIAMITSGNDKAIALAVELINKNKTPFVKDSPFIQAAIISKNANLHEWLRANVTEKELSKEENKSIIDHAFASYLKLEKEEKLALSVDSLSICFKDTLANLDVAYLINLFEDDRVQLQLLAAQMLNINNTPVEELPDELFLKMIISDHEEIRNQGMALLAKLNDETLTQKIKLLGDLAIGKRRDLRLHAKEIIGRLVAKDDNFRNEIFQRAYPVLLENQEDEDLHPDVYQLIKDHLHGALPLMLSNIDEVIKDNHRETHLLTYDLLTQYAKLENWPMDIIAALGNHDMLEIREIAYNYYKDNLARVKYEKEEALKIMDSHWEETRTFGFNYFDEHFDEADWNPTLIIALCDNVRPEVQEYGTRVLGKYFKDEHGIEYLDALSEHPDPVIQLYTTNYLDRYAFNNMGMLNKLEPYFRTVLTSINKKRVAKYRVYRFFQKQIKEGETYAQYVAKIMNDMVVTNAITYKEKCILLLYDIKKQYPHIESDLEIVPLEQRN